MPFNGARLELEVRFIGFLDSAFEAVEGRGGGPSVERGWMAVSYLVFFLVYMQYKVYIPIAGFRSPSSICLPYSK